MWFASCVCVVIYFSFAPGTSRTPASNIIDIIKREGEAEDERKYDKGVLLCKGINNIVVFVVLSETFAPLFGDDLSSIIGINKSLIGHAIAAFTGACTTRNNGLIKATVCSAGYTANNELIKGVIAAQTAGFLAILNGLIKGLFAAQLAVLYVSFWILLHFLLLRILLIIILLMVQCHHRQQLIIVLKKKEKKNLYLMFLTCSFV